MSDFPTEYVKEKAETQENKWKKFAARAEIIATIRCVAVGQVATGDPMWQPRSAHALDSSLAIQQAQKWQEFRKMPMDSLSQLGHLVCTLKS